ncbi:hypothetical protein Ddye_013649 [Dipteronia dyeriana]|uniref:Uncharacterized protein n=1 Tax=Dipteronia dyeriana TaxID=168575 RepID=A0AAD9X6T3_9ROSI|nr:hypothetical protein Ddye_013649 [Dipteronia dyeriana]
MAIEKACSVCVLNPVLKDRVIETVSDSMMTVTWINGDSFGSLRHVDKFEAGCAGFLFCLLLAAALLFF